MKERVLNYFKNNKKEIFFVFLITIIAIVLRVCGLLNNDFLWIDEIFSYQFSSPETLKGVFEQLKYNDSNMPLFYVVLHYWIKFFGKDLFVLGLLPLIFGILTVPCIFYVTKDLFNKKTAYISSILLSISCLHIYYSFELRMYSMLAFFALLSTYFLIKFLNDFSLKNNVCLIIFTIFTFYTSNMGFMFLFSQFCIVFVYVFFKNRSVLFNILKSYLIIGLICLPGINFLISRLISEQTANCSLASFLHFNLVYFWSLLQEFFGSNLTVFWGSSSTPFEVLPPFLPYFLSFYFPILIGILMLIFGCFQKNKNFFFLFLISSFYTFIIYFLSYFKFLPYWSRYLFIIYPLVIICFAFSIYQINKKNKIVISILLAYLFIYLYSMFTNRIGIYGYCPEVKIDQYVEQITQNDFLINFAYFDNYNSYLKIKAPIINFGHGAYILIKQLNNDDFEQIRRYIKSGQIHPKFISFTKSLPIYKMKSNDNLYINAFIYENKKIFQQEVNSKIDNADISSLIDYTHKKNFYDFISILEKDFVYKGATTYKNDYVFYVFSKK